MITPVLKLSEIKKDPVCLLGWDRHAMITRYGDVVAYVVSPERMNELLNREAQSREYIDTLNKLASGELDVSDLINL